MDGSKKTSSGGALLVIRVTGDEGLLTHTPGSAWGTEDVQLGTNRLYTTLARPALPLLKEAGNEGGGQCFKGGSQAMRSLSFYSLL